jgi:hypothetical protein
MNLLISSLNNERIDKVYMGCRNAGGSDVIVHLKSEYTNHISGYSLLRISDEGLMRFKSIGKSPSNPNLFKCMDIDRELKLCIIGIDLI